MGVTADIFRSWRHPRQVMAARLAEGLREDRALIFLMTGCFLIFVAQWPRLQSLAMADPTTPLDVRLGGALLGWMFIMPLVFYATAAFSHLAARAVGGQGSWYSARLALFWAVLAATPAWLVNGLVVGLNAGPLVQGVVGAVALAGFIGIWFASLVEAETTGAQA